MGRSLPPTNWKYRWGPAWSGCFLCKQAPSNCAPIAIWRPSCCVRCQMLLLGVAVSWRSRCGNRMLVKNRKLLEFTTHEIQINSYCWPTCSPWCLPSTRGSAAPGAGAGRAAVCFGGARTQDAWCLVRDLVPVCDQTVTSSCFCSKHQPLKGFLRLQNYSWAILLLDSCLKGEQHHTNKKES